MTRSLNTPAEAVDGTISAAMGRHSAARQRGSIQSKLARDSERRRRLSSHRRAGARYMRVTIANRIDALDWADLNRQLDERGFALTPPTLTPAECEELAQLFDQGRFRSTIEMARHRFGDGR